MVGGIIFGAITVSFILLIVLAVKGESNVLAKETAQLDSIVVEVNTAIENNDYDIARVKAAQLVWQGKSSQANKETWDQKRELLLQELERLQGNK
jgi:hypothetical protein